jgi:hypothetical protein
MEQKVRKARTKKRTVTGDPDCRIKWVDPDLLTEGEQAALYREFYAQRRNYLNRQNQLVLEWRDKNAERRKEKAREYYQKNREKLRDYGKKYREIKKATS